MAIIAEPVDVTGTEEWEIRYCPALGVFVRTLEIWLPSVFRSTASVKGVSAPYEAHRSCRYCPWVDSLYSLVPCLPFGSMEWHASLLSHLPSSFFHFNRYRPEETSGQALPTEVRKRKKKKKNVAHTLHAFRFTLVRLLRTVATKPIAGAIRMLCS